MSSSIVQPLKAVFQLYCGAVGTFMNGGSVKGASGGGAGPLHHYDLPRVTLAAERQANASIYYVKTPLHYHYAAAAAVHGASDRTIARCACARCTYGSRKVAGRR